MTTQARLNTVFWDLGGTLTTNERFSAVSAGLKGAKMAFSALKDRSSDMPGSLAFYSRVMNALTKIGASANSNEEVRIDEEIRALFQSLGKKLNDEELKLAVASWYEPFAEHAAPRPETGEVLKTLKERGFALGLVSNTAWPKWVIEGEIQRFGLADMFNVVELSSEIGVRKPSPIIFEAALKKAAAAPDQSVFVGDSLKMDISGARYVGMRTVYLNVSGEADDAGLADAEISSLAELPSIIDNWLK